MTQWGARLETERHLSHGAPFARWGAEVALLGVPPAAVTT